MFPWISYYFKLKWCLKAAKIGYLLIRRRLVQKKMICNERLASKLTILRRSCSFLSSYICISASIRNYIIISYRLIYLHVTSYTWGRLNCEFIQLKKQLWHNCAVYRKVKIKHPIQCSPVLFHCRVFPSL